MDSSDCFLSILHLPPNSIFFVQKFRNKNVLFCLKVFVLQNIRICIFLFKQTLGNSWKQKLIFEQTFVKSESSSSSVWMQNRLLVILETEKVQSVSVLLFLMHFCAHNASKILHTQNMKRLRSFFSLNFCAKVKKIAINILFCQWYSSKVF